MQDNSERQAFIKMEGIRKSFAGVNALKGVSLELYPGEILALIGENGAGKSTLMRCLMGIEKKDAGVIYKNGEEIDPQSPTEANNYGIGMVFQEQALFPNLSVLENIFLGFEHGMMTGIFLNWNQMYDEAKMILEKVRLDYIDPKTKLEKLSFAERQMVELARVLYPAVKEKQQHVIILDEPTAVLSPDEVKRLFDVCDSLREHATFIFISHKLDEIINYTDRVEVMKDGENVGGILTKDATIQKLQSMMVGREFSGDYYFADRLRIPEEDVVLTLDNVNGPTIHNISFKLKKGEILGVAGLMGCGKEDLAKTIFGDMDIESGTIKAADGDHFSGSIEKAVNKGLGYLPSDRRAEAILGILSVLKNTTIANLSNFTSKGFLDSVKEKECTVDYIEKLAIKTPSENTLIMNLSGGNQQKVILARWLSRKPTILVMEQPTRGIDVGAKQEIYKIMRDLADEGISILVISDEMQELIGLSNRILAMRDGEITAEIDCQKEDKPDENEIIGYIA